MRIVLSVALALVVLAILLLGSLAVLYSTLGIPFPLSVVLAVGALGVATAAIVLTRGVRRLRRRERRRTRMPALRRTAAAGLPVRRPLIEAAVLLFD